MSLFQFAAAVDGVNEMNAGDTVDPPTADEFAAMKRLHGFE